MRKITKKIFKGHLAYIALILMSFFSHLLLKLHFCVFLLFLLLNFGFTSSIYILVFYSVFGKRILGSFITDQIGKNEFTTKFVTAANSL